MKRALPLGLLAVLFAAGRAWAQADLVYLGAGLTQESVSHFVLTSAPAATSEYPDINATSWKVFLGLHPIAPFAIEAEYLGTTGSSQNLCCGIYQRSELSGSAAYAVGILGPPSYAAFVKAGVSDWKLSAPGVAAGATQSGTSFAFGVGFQAYFGRIGIRTEYQQFNMGMTNGLQMFSLDAVLNVF
jgi:hypothetical protein